MTSLHKRHSTALDRAEPVNAAKAAWLSGLLSASAIGSGVSRGKENLSDFPSLMHLERCLRFSIE